MAVITARMFPVRHDKDVATVSSSTPLYVHLTVGAVLWQALSDKTYIVIWDNQYTILLVTVSVAAPYGLYRSESIHRCESAA